ncbi:MAG: tRNA guanosine(34) transglycosylase Tgt [Nanoarchaeota archaeon]
MVFTILHRDTSTAARIGVLQTKSGKIETPFFMPVATKATAKFVNSKQLEEIGTPAVISNAFILSVQPGKELLKKIGGIKKFMQFNGINFTDSGGFQMYSDSLYISSNDRGVLFKNPVSGENIFMTPEENMDLQISVDADVAMCLDSMPRYSNSKEEIKKAVERTILWAGRCKKTHDKLQKKIARSRRQLLFAISQGGIYSDLRKLCIEKLLLFDFDGYAIGGVAMPEFTYGGDMEKIKKMEQSVIKAHKKVVGENKICYLMGEGDPVWMSEAIALGVDCFDSRMPTQSARRGTLFTSKGRLKLLNKKYKKDMRTIDQKCSCFTCKHYSRAYVRFLLREKESVGMELASIHNLFYMQTLINGVKKAIRKNCYKKFLQDLKRKYDRK